MEMEGKMRQGMMESNHGLSLNISAAEFYGDEPTEIGRRQNGI